MEQTPSVLSDTLSSYSDYTCLYLYIEFVLIKYIYKSSEETQNLIKYESIYNKISNLVINLLRPRLDYGLQTKSQLLSVTKSNLSAILILRLCNASHNLFVASFKFPIDNVSSYILGQTCTYRDVRSVLEDRIQTLIR